MLRQFVLHGHNGASPDKALKLPGSAFAMSDAARSTTLRRLWLDTFDWRLYRSGLTLEQVSTRGATELVLTGRDGTVIATDHVVRPKPEGKHGAGAGGEGGNGRGARWPGPLEALPLGPLRDHLAPVLGVRALLPVARAVSTARDWRVLNSDDKTIARITVDRMAVTYPAAAEVPPRVVVTALRGYQAQAQRVSDLLAGMPGVSGGSESGLEAALAAAGRRPGDYTGKVDVRLSPRMPAAVAMAAVLSSLFDTIEANVSGTVRDVDTEFLHDLRIAVRRTRTALKLAGDVLPSGVAARFRAEFKWLGDLTTPTRDLDVYLLSYPDMAEGLIAATPGELKPFHDHLQRSRAAEQRRPGQGLAFGPVRAAPARVAAGPGGRRHDGHAALRRAAGRQPDRPRAPPGAARRQRDHPLLAPGEPARAAEALQGTALPAGVLRLAVRPGRAVAGGQGAEGAAGLPRRVPGHPGAAR